MNGSADKDKQKKPDTSDYVVAVEDEPDTVDFQCTTIHYTIATNVFDRLVEMEKDANGETGVVPSLAKSWDISDDGCTYTFHLRDDVKFSNGNPLTSSDVLYTVTRLLTHPDSCNQDIAEPILGAEELMEGKTDKLEGFKILGDYDFSVTLKKPFEAYLACLSMPGASILDEESTKKAGDKFGKDPAFTIGTGPYVLKKWKPGVGLLLAADRKCWSGPPNNDGLDLRFMSEPEDVRAMFENGELDVLDLDEVGNSAEFFYHGDIYQDRLYKVQRIATSYIALNESVKPLNDVRVRKALQLALNRMVLLDGAYSGRGTSVEGIYPKGLYGFNPKLEPIPYDTDKAKKLLAKAGYPKGFDMTITMKSTSTQSEMTLLRLVSSMWDDIGVTTKIDVVSEDDFMAARKSGKLACYTAMWTADYNDPDDLVYTFFGNQANTTFRSLCYPNEKIMKRVREARVIPDKAARLREYQDLEKIIVQKDAAWIPLFSRQYTYLTSKRAEGLEPSWNGSVKVNYRKIHIKKTH